CAAGGFYQDAAFNSQAFVVDEANGTWGVAHEVPGTAALDPGSPGAMIVSLSCAAAGDCSAGGVYSDASDRPQAVVADESGGIWGASREVPGTAVLNAGGLGGTQAVSCAPAGGCSAGGSYTNANGNTQVFVVSQAGGWAAAIIPHEEREQCEAYPRANFSAAPPAPPPRPPHPP